MCVGGAYVHIQDHKIEKENGMWMCKMLTFGYFRQKGIRKFFA
jgi:hypothetical protein